MRPLLTERQRFALRLLSKHGGRLSRSGAWWVDGEGVHAIRHDDVIALQARGLLEVDEESIPWREADGWKSRRLTRLGWLVAEDLNAEV